MSIAQYLAFFAQMKEERIASLSYHKFSGELWPEQEFRTHKVSLVNGEHVSMAHRQLLARVSRYQRSNSTWPPSGWWLTEKEVLAMSPAREVKTERFSRTEGKTPAFVEGEVQKLSRFTDAHRLNLFDRLCFLPDFATGIDLYRFDESHY